MMNTRILYTLAAMLAVGAAVSCTKTDIEGETGEPVNKAAATAFGEEGAVNGLFAIGPDAYVLFSRGNLQYSTSGTHATADGASAPGTWRFAERQYETVGAGNGSASATYGGWIDIFGWGTSGWSGGAVCHRPYDTAAAAASYMAPAGGSIAATNADWGQYNAISNGGDRSGLWRTLTKVEWEYVLSGTSDDEAYNRSSMWGWATVNGVKGLVLAPNRRRAGDGEVYLWRLPEGLAFTPGKGEGWETNVYNGTEWEKMESTGVVFLPATGWRSPQTRSWTFDNGSYWTATNSVGGAAFAVLTTPDCKPYLASTGFSVRLATDWAE